MVSVAQLVESRIVIPVVVGSSPIIHPILLYLKVISEQRLTNLKLVEIDLSSLSIYGTGANRMLRLK